MRINVAIPEEHVTAPVLDGALETVTRLNEDLIRSGSAPPFDPAAPGVRWRPEPPGQEHFDHARMVSGRGWGDCDDLAPWHAATLRATGEDPDAEAVVRRSGEKRWHAVVRRGDGSIDDPSLDAGMPRKGRGVGVVGAVLPIMLAGPHEVGAYLARPQLALRPVRDSSGQVEAWQARTDLPWHSLPSSPSPTDVAMVSLHASPVSSQAIVGACEGAIALGEAAGGADDDHLDRLEAICDACNGASWEELAAEYGPEHADAAGHIVGSFFGKVFRKVKKAAKSVVKNPLRSAYTAATLPFGGRAVVRKLAPIAIPTVTKALNFVPAVGPVASMALQAATPTLQRLIKSGGYLRPEARAAQAAMQAPSRYPPATGMPYMPQQYQQYMPQQYQQYMPQQYFPQPYSFR